MTEELEETQSSWIDGIKAHPWITGIFACCVVLWIALALIFLPDDWNQITVIP